MANEHSIYAEHRAYFNGILEIMTRSESELVARLDELREQKKFVETAIASLNVYEHINSKETTNG